MTHFMSVSSLEQSMLCRAMRSSDGVKGLLECPRSPTASDRSQQECVQVEHRRQGSLTSMEDQQTIKDTLYQCRVEFNELGQSRNDFLLY